MAELAIASLRRSEDARRSHDEVVAKLREELNRERASRMEATARFEEELNKAKALQEEAWKSLKYERRLHEENTLSEKAAFKATLKEENRIRTVSETRIKALEEELKGVRGVLNKIEADLKGARARIRSAMAEFKNSPGFESYIELRRHQWVLDFHRSKGFQIEMQQATLDRANRVLDKLKALHPEWNFLKKFRRTLLRPPE